MLCLLLNIIQGEQNVDIPFIRIVNIPSRSLGILEDSDLAGWLGRGQLGVEVTESPGLGRMGY